VTGGHGADSGAAAVVHPLVPPPAARALIVATEAVWYVSLLGSAVTAAVLTGRAALQALSGDPLTSPFGARVSLPDALASTWSGAGQLDISGIEAQVSPARPSGLFVLLALGLFALAAAWWLFLVHQVRGVVRSLRVGEPFTVENARRIARLGWALISAGVLEQVVDVMLAASVQAQAPLDGAALEIAAEVPFGFFFAGLGCLALAKVFRIGTEMRIDQSLTI